MKPEVPPILTGSAPAPRKKQSWILIAVAVLIASFTVIGIVGRAASSVLSVMTAKTSQAVEADNRRIQEGEVVERTDYAPGPEGEFHKIYVEYHNQARKLEKDLDGTLERLHTEDILSLSHMVDKNLIQSDLAAAKMSAEATDSHFKQRLALLADYEENIEKYFFKSTLARDCSRVEKTGMPTRNYLVKLQRLHQEFFGHTKSCLTILQGQFGFYNATEDGIEFASNTPQAVMDAYDQHTTSMNECMEKIDKLTAEYEASSPKPPESVPMTP